MSEYFHVEKPFLDQLATLRWTVIDQGHSLIPSDPAKSLRSTFREWILPDVFRKSVRAINLTPAGCEWLTERQLDDLRDQLSAPPQPHTARSQRGSAGAALFKAQVDLNEVTGEADPIVQLIDFAHPERNVFHAINQFRVDTPGCVKAFIIPDIVLFVNGVPLVVIEAKIGDANTANPMHEAFVQLLRYRNARPETARAGLTRRRAATVLPQSTAHPHLRRESRIRHHHVRPKNISTLGRTSGRTIAAVDTPPLGVEREQETLDSGAPGARTTLLDMLRTCTVFMDYRAAGG